MTINRVDAPTISDEQTSLLAWLDYHRDTLLLKAAGLDCGKCCLRFRRPDRLPLPLAAKIIRESARVARRMARA